MADPLKAAKAALRKQVLVQRATLPDRAARSARITEHLLALDSLRQARTVMAYMSMGSEFDTRAFIDHLRLTGKTLVLPRVAGKRKLALHIVRDPATELQPGVWGIAEPVAGRTEVIAPEAVEWILTPGVAFTAAGLRLGYGGGYYDTLLNACTHHPLCVAAAFDMQVLDALPADALDHPVGMVVSEAAARAC